VGDTSLQKKETSEITDIWHAANKKFEKAKSKDASNFSARLFLSPY
jgi:hypothetical protein